MPRIGARNTFTRTSYSGISVCNFLVGGSVFLPVDTYIRTRIYTRFIWTIIPPNPSLVKYENPVLVSTSTKKGKASKQKGKLPPVDSKRAPTQTEDILNSILPPREWTEDGQLWVQYVSSTPATRLDVINLQEALDQRLQQRQARETGICPIREELYAQTFDELIRQVTINCRRGLLLLRVCN